MSNRNMAIGLILTLVLVAVAGFTSPLAHAAPPEVAPPAATEWVNAARLGQKLYCGAEGRFVVELWPTRKGGYSLQVYDWGKKLSQKGEWFGVYKGWGSWRKFTSLIKVRLDWVSTCRGGGICWQATTSVSCQPARW